MTIAAEKRDPIAGLDSHLLDGAGQPCRAVGELRVGQTMLAADDSSLVRILLAGVAKKPNWSQWNVHDGLVVTRRTDLHPPQAHGRSRKRKRLRQERQPRPSDHNLCRSVAAGYDLTGNLFCARSPSLTCAWGTIPGRGH